MEFLTFRFSDGSEVMAIFSWEVRSRLSSQTPSPFARSAESAETWKGYPRHDRINRKTGSWSNYGTSVR
jgi:hypothetical protein